MTDTSETPSAAPVDDTRTYNKNLIFAALAESGIHSVTVDYDGSGDSGQIESIEAWTATNEKVPAAVQSQIAARLWQPRRSAHRDQSGSRH
jgi:hypothetical protein